MYKFKYLVRLNFEVVGDNHLSRYNMVKIKVKNFTPKRNHRSNVNKKGLKISIKN